MRDSITVRVSIDPLLHQRFKDKAKGEGRTMAWLIDQWIRRYVEPETVYHAPDMSKYLDGSGTSGMATPAVEIHEVDRPVTPIGKPIKPITKAEQAKGRSRK